MSKRGDERVREHQSAWMVKTDRTLYLVADPRRLSSARSRGLAPLQVVVAHATGSFVL